MEKIEKILYSTNTFLVTLLVLTALYVGYEFFYNTKGDTVPLPPHVWDSKLNTQIYQPIPNIDSLVKSK